MSTCSLEVAVYQVGTPSPFTALQTQAHRHLADVPGFRRGAALRGAEDPGLRADLVVWDSAAAAQAAAAAIQEDERFSAFMKAIDEVRHFAHYDGVTPDILDAVARAPAVEVAIYKASGDAPMIELQAGVHAALATLDGAIASAAGARRDGDDLILLDLIGWRDPAAHAAAPAVLQKEHPELAPFFTGMGDILVFEMFEVAR